MQVSNLFVLISMLYCSAVSKHILFPREPDSGNNTASARDALVTYAISEALVANEHVVA